MLYSDHTVTVSDKKRFKEYFCSVCFSWKEMWLQDYWQSLDQGEALTAMIHHNESHQGKFWDYMHKIFLKRTQHN